MLDGGRLCVRAPVGSRQNYKTDICCFSVKHAPLRSKSEDWLALNEKYMSEWSDMSVRMLLFQWASTIKIPSWSMERGWNHHLIEMCLVLNMSRSWKWSLGVKQQSLAQHTVNYSTLSREYVSQLPIRYWIGTISQLPIHHWIGNR